MWERGKCRPHWASATLADKGGVQGHCVSGGLPADSPSSVVSLSDLLGFMVLAEGSVLHFKHYNGFSRDNITTKAFYPVMGPN